MSLLEEVRDTALSLPATEERAVAGGLLFLVAGRPFAALAADGTGLRLRVDAPPGDAVVAVDALPDVAAAGWSQADPSQSDGATLEDRLARAWELSAPAALLEAGGR